MYTNHLNRRLSDYVIHRALLILGWLVFGVKLATAQTLSLEEALNQALACSPGLQATQTQARALSALPGQRGSPPDQRLSLNAQILPVDTFSPSQEPMTQLQIGISQNLPSPGKLALQEQAAEMEAKATAKTVYEQRLQLARNVKTVLWNMFYLDRTFDVVQRNQSLMKQAISVAQSKYEVDQGNQQDILLAQLELSKLQLKQVNLQDMLNNEQARLNTLLGRDEFMSATLASTQTKLPLVLTRNKTHSLQTVLEQRPQMYRTSEKRTFIPTTP